MTDQQITMGAGLTAPERAFRPGPTDRTPAAGDAAPVQGATPPAGVAEGRPRRSPHRRLLGAAAVASPLLATAFAATDPGPLPREPAADFLGAAAAHPTAFVASTTLQLAAMAAGVALAAYVVLTLAPRAPRLAPVVGVLLTLGYVGGTAFAGAKLVAADLVAGGAPRPGALEVWSAVHTGPLFDVASWPLLMAIPGNLLLAVLLLRCRAVVGWWPAAGVVLGFVLASGELPQPATVAGWAVQAVVVAHVVRRTLRDER